MPPPFLRGDYSKVFLKYQCYKISLICTLTVGALRSFGVKSKTKKFLDFLILLAVLTYYYIINVITIKTVTENTLFLLFIYLGGLLRWLSGRAITSHSGDRCSIPGCDRPRSLK